MNGNVTEIRSRTAAAISTAEDAGLSIVVPFTTPKQTRAALKHAAEMSSGLNGTIRLIDAVAIPIQRPISEPQVNGKFLKRRLEEMAEETGMPVHVDIVYTRDRMECLSRCLGVHSLVVIALRSLWWPSFERKLARFLRRAGHDVVLISRDATRS